MSTFRWTGRAFVFIAALVVFTPGARAATMEFFNYTTFSANVNTPTVYGFDNFSTGTVLAGNELPGITISARRITVINPEDFNPGQALTLVNVNSQPHGISASEYYSSPGTVTFDNGDDNLDFTLTMSKTAAGLWIGNMGAFDGDTSTPTTVTFLDSLGGTIATETLQQGHSGMIGSGASNRIFYGITSDTLIAKIRVLNGAGDNDGIILDDVQFATVPEPSTAFVLLGGIATAAGLRRRTRGHV